VKVIKRRK